MRVLITCEFSGKVSEAFRDAGHRAYSCDLLPTEGDPEHHIQADALDVIAAGCYCNSRKAYLPWELIGIHYTCTFFTLSGVQWMYRPRTDGNSGRSSEIDLVRRGQMILAAKEFSKLWGAAIATGAKVYFENPQMHGMAQMEISNRTPGWNIRPTQWIQPCDYGHPETKKTGLWLQGLPALKPTKIVRNEMQLLPQKERARASTMPLPVRTGGKNVVARCRASPLRWRSNGPTHYLW